MARMKESRDKQKVEEGREKGQAALEGDMMKEGRESAGQCRS